MREYQVSVYVKSIQIRHLKNNFRYQAVINNVHFETDCDNNMYKVYKGKIENIGVAENKKGFTKLIIKNL